MRRHWLIGLLLMIPPTDAIGWGADGHSIVAEIAQREVSDSTRVAIDQLLNHATLSSISNWADDIKFTAHPETYSWHFTDIPLKNEKYTSADCHYTDKAGLEYKTCLNTALEELKNKIRCGVSDDEKRDALRYIVHLVGDATQPLHTVDDLTGGNGLMVQIDFCGDKDGAGCHLPEHRVKQKFHEVWDTTLISSRVWSFGAYVDLLYLASGWMNSAEAKNVDVSGNVESWVNETHALAREIWTDDILGTPPSISQNYYNTVKPKLDRQLGTAGLRLAKYLDAAFAPGTCK
jgi:hypothetical protein